MKDNYTVTEYKIARVVLEAFKRADPCRLLRDRKIFNSSRETLCDGGCLCIWPNANRVNLSEPPK